MIKGGGKPKFFDISVTSPRQKITEVIVYYINNLNTQSEFFGNFNGEDGTVAAPLVPQLPKFHKIVPLVSRSGPEPFGRQLP
jgi:hypothetical protein